MMLRCVRFVGEDPVEGAPAHAMHWRVALDVEPDGTHCLLEGPRLAAFPFEVVAAKVVTEKLSTMDVEEMPSSDEVEGRVGRTETPNIEDPGKTAF